MTWNLTPIKKTLQVKQKRKIGQLHDFYSGQCQEKGLVISKEFFFKTIQNLRCSGKLLIIVSVFFWEFFGRSLKGNPHKFCEYGR